MPVMRSYRNGATAFVPRNREPKRSVDALEEIFDEGSATDALTGPPEGEQSSPPPSRERITGWTRKSVRNHTRFLYAVDAPALDGYGYALTLTVREIPTQAAWVRMKRAWQARAERLPGFKRLHWVTEWQARGAPHLHCAIYYEQPLRGRGTELLFDWVECTVEAGTALRSQDAKPIHGEIGWLQYLSKHAARGAAHYQRQGAPPGWEKTGRLWGHRGAWPTVQHEDVIINGPAYWWLRRQVRRWRMADARSESDPVKRARRIKAAKDMLRGHGPNADIQRNASMVRGISEWLPWEMQMQLVMAAALLFPGLVHRPITDEATGETLWVDPVTGELHETPQPRSVSPLEPSYDLLPSGC